MFTSVSRTAHRLIMHVEQYSCFVVRLLNSLLLSCASQLLITAFRELCRNDYTKRQYRTLQNCGKG